MGGQQTSFEERVARIKQRNLQTTGSGNRIRTESIWQRLAYPASFVGAFLLGFFAVFLTRYIRYHMVGVPEAGQLDTQEIVSVVMASGAGFFVSFFLRDRKKEFASLVTLGVLCSTFTFHNLVWAYPEVFEYVYGEDWVEFIQKLTEPSSLYMFGNSVVFG